MNYDSEEHRRIGRAVFATRRLYDVQNDNIHVQYTQYILLSKPDVFPRDIPVWIQITSR